MLVVKITLCGGIELFVPFNELTKFKARFANIEKLEGIEMDDDEYSKIPLNQQSDIFFEKNEKET